MREIIVTTHVTLDGVMQAPHGSDEDSSGGFNFGGWTASVADAASGKLVQKEMNQPVDYLLGRKTFELFASFWPKHAAMWPRINEGTKYVLSKTINRSDWTNTVFLQNLTDIQHLKLTEGPPIQVWGSSELTHLLLENGLVDQLHLRISPLVLGQGKKLFNNASMPTAFRLVEHMVTSKGVLIVHYQRADEMFPSATIQTLVTNYLN